MLNTAGLFESGTLNGGGAYSTRFTPGFSERTGQTDRVYYSDYLGSTRKTTDSSAKTVPTGTQAYDAYGKMVGGGAGVNTRFSFAGATGYEGTPEVGRNRIHVTGSILRISSW